MFDSQLKDDGIRQMSKDNSESLDTIITLNLTHQKLSKHASLLPSILSVYQEQTEPLFKVLMNWREINPTMMLPVSHHLVFSFTPYLKLKEPLPMK
jgi:hypothetical protein